MGQADQLVDYEVQRRRKPKAAPANVFSGGQKPKKAKKSAQAPLPPKKPPIARSSPPKPTPRSSIKSEQEIRVEDASIEAEKIEVVEAQGYQEENLLVLRSKSALSNQKYPASPKMTMR